MNPGSNSGKSKKQFQQIFNYLDDNNVDYEYELTTDLHSAYLLSQKANNEKYDIIVAVGGDGTINKTMNGFFDNKGIRISNAKMGVIYTGTSPDFCKSYNIPWKNIVQALEILLKCKSQKIKIGKITFAKTFDEELDQKLINDSTDFTTEYFACCANIGLGATLARYANKGIRKYLGDNIGTFLSLIKTIYHYKANKFTIKQNEKFQTISSLFSLSIGITKYIASGIKVNHNLSENDTRFYTLIVESMKLKNIPEVLKKIYSGKKIINNDIVHLDYTNTIEIMGNNQNPEVEFDGDPQGFLPCKIEMAQDELELIMK